LIFIQDCSKNTVEHYISTGVNTPIHILIELWSRGTTLKTGAELKSQTSKSHLILFLMKRTYRSLGVLLAVGAISLLQACQKDDQFSAESDAVALKKAGSINNPDRTFYSQTLPIGNGVARAWVTENLNGKPVAVGINLSDKALENLPAEPAMFTFTLPKNKGENFYTFVALDWNPHGHEPPYVYDLPHFDFHFYIIPDEEVMGIPLLTPPQMDVAPYPQYVPPLYIQTPGIVPQMGAHWVDVTSPEFNGGTFTRTFIWGSYAGEFIFWEPMVTRAFLLSKPDEIINLRQPSAFQRDGYYPTQYCVTYSVSPKQYTIALLNLQYHEGE